ncbi:MAG: LURP-one-related family protein, partial [Ktedonobacteraceae bacterium]|nr:LURP-one-related family protein [Ktedonobacteraceae bacterium]
MRYHIKERVLSLGDDFVVRDDSGNVVYEVDGKLFHIADSFSIRDRNSGEEVAHVKQKLFAYTREYTISKDGQELATIRKRQEETMHGDLFEVASRDGMVFHIQGDFKEWDFNIVDHYGRLLGHISKEFAILGDHYTVDTSPNV